MRTSNWPGVDPKCKCCKGPTRIGLSAHTGPRCRPLPCTLISSSTGSFPVELRRPSALEQNFRWVLCRNVQCCHPPSRPNMPKPPPPNGSHTSCLLSLEGGEICQKYALCNNCMKSRTLHLRNKPMVSFSLNSLAVGALCACGHGVGCRGGLNDETHTHVHTFSLSHPPPRSCSPLRVSARLPACQPAHLSVPGAKNALS